jgi:signal peptidase I
VVHGGAGVAGVFLTRIDMRASRKRQLRLVARELRAIALLLLGVMVARSTLADHYHVPSGSMEPALLTGDRIFVYKLAYGLRVPFTTVRIFGGDVVQRGDIVIFDSPRDRKRLVKRIVAVGGDEVAIRNGRLSINGRAAAIDETGASERLGERVFRLNLQHGGGPDYRARVPSGQLLAVGDHRGNSVDGRSFGLIDATEVYGRALAVYYRRGNGFGWRPL